MSLSPQEIGFVLNASSATNDANAAQQEVIASAENRLITRCMASAGFSYTAPVDPPTTLPPAATNPLGTDEQAAITSTGTPTPEAEVIAERRTNGYGLYAYFLASTLRNVPPPENPSFLALPKQQQQKWTRALNGPSASTVVKLPGGGQFSSGVSAVGCYGRALARLYGSVTTAEDIAYVPQQLESNVTDAVSSDAAVVRASSSWSRCITSRGSESFASPTASRVYALHLYKGVARTPGALGTKRPEEIALAVSDAQCAYSTGLMSAYAHAFMHAINHVAPAEYGAIVALTRDQALAQQRAAGYLSRQGA